MHCLNLKVTYNCTNKCSFCFSSYLKKSNINKENLKNAIIQGKNAGCNELVLSGGEPTTEIETLISLIKLAETLEYKKYIIQTNGFGFAHNSELVNFVDLVSKNKEVCISFSVHGHNAILHDTMSGKTGAFKSVKSALEKIKETDCKIYTNTVITSLNINYLEDIAQFVLQYSPEIMQFSMLHLKNPNDLTVSLLDSVLAVKKLKGRVNEEILKTEGMPYCLLHGMEKCVGESFWPSVLDLYNKNENYIKDFNQLDYGMRQKLDICGKCIFNEICTGVWKEHFDEFSKMKIRPIC